jgi:hypothetical protein
MSQVAASPFADRTVFVLGPVRSGTTWLVQLLLAHPELAGLSWESTLFMGLWDVWENAHRADGEGISAQLDEQDLAAVLRVFCDSVFSMGRDETGGGAPWFVEKTPDNVNRLPLMATVYPDAWYVHVLRDGRDVVRSQLRAPWGTDDAAEAARNWVLGVRQVRSHAWRLQRFTEVRYEDVCADPVARIADLLHWMGVGTGDDVTREIKERAPRQMARYGATDPVGPGKWVDLSPAQRQAVYDVAGDLLAELGYLAESTER